VNVLVKVHGEILKLEMNVVTWCMSIVAGLFPPWNSVTGF